MKPSQEKYDSLPARDKMGPVNIPGVYCQGCGETFALYRYSVLQPDGFDENGKAYYRACFNCKTGFKVANDRKPDC